MWPRSGSPLLRSASTAPASGRSLTRPALTGSSPAPKTIGIVVVAALAANANWNLRSRRLPLPSGEPVRPPAPAAARIDLSPAIFDRHVLALDIAGVLEALAECAHTVRKRVRRCTAEEPNHRHRRLLSPCCEGPCSRPAAKERDELAALCMSGKQHSEGRRGFGHDRLPVATGSPQALRILNRE